MKYIDDLVEDMALHGIHPADPGRIQCSGEWERLRSCEGKKGNSDIFLRYFHEYGSVKYGDWRQGGDIYTYYFSPKDRKHLDSFKRISVISHRDNATDDSARETFHRTFASAIYESNSPASQDHPYLVKKHILPHCIKQSEDGLLVIPVYGPSQDIVGIQFIDPDGNKRFMKGSSMKGGHLVIDGKRKGIIFLVEGFATGASTVEQTGMLTYIAFSAGNLAPVACMVKKNHPDERIVIIADNDASGTGQTKAEEAAEAAGIEYVVIPHEGWDANDFVNNGGRILDLIEQEKKQ